jgi:hypothetical protein
MDSVFGCTGSERSCGLLREVVDWPGALVAGSNYEE